jgi:negative regulator of sigma E activity
MSLPEHIELKEQLSALLDGELDRDQALFLLKRMEHDSALRALWERMCQCGDVLREEPLCTAGFAERVQEALAKEAEPAFAVAHAGRQNGRRSWFGTAAGGALAAAMAYAVVLIGSQTGTPEEALPVLAADSDHNARSAAAITGAMSVASPVFNTASARFGESSLQPLPASLNLDNYLLRHSEALSGGLHGEMQPFIYPVSHSDAQTYSVR